MIYLVGGSPRCGKTILAKLIAKQKRISWLSTDVLWSVVLATTPKSLLKKRFPGQVLPQIKGKYNFETYQPSLLFKNQITEAESIWPGVKEVILQLIDCDYDYVIEGVHLLPKLVSQLKTTKGWPKLKVIYLIKTDTAKIKRDIPKNKDQADWILRGGVDVPGRLDLASQMIQYKSRYFEKEAKKYHFKVVNTEDNFTQKIKSSAKLLFKIP